MNHPYASPAHPAVREIDALNRSHTAGDYTNDEFEEQLESVIVRHGGRRAVLKTHANGISKIGIFSPENLLIAEYHSQEKPSSHA